MTAKIVNVLFSSFYSPILILLISLPKLHPYHPDMNLCSRTYWLADEREVKTCWLLMATSQMSSNGSMRLNGPGFALDVSFRSSAEKDEPLNRVNDLDWTAIKPRWYATTLTTAPIGMISWRDPLMSYTWTHERPTNRRPYRPTYSESIVC